MSNPFTIFGKKIEDFFSIHDCYQLSITPQSPIFHAEGDVATHTNMVIDALTMLPEYQQLPVHYQEILYFTAMFHDIAKGFTLTYENGVPRHPHHSLKGALWWRFFAWKNNIPLHVREPVARLILLHQKLFFILNKEDYVRELTKYHTMVPLSLLTIFAKADIMGRIAPDIQQHLDTLSLIDDEISHLPILLNVERIEWLRHGRGYPGMFYENGKGSRVHVMIGLPASGKDTFISQKFPLLPVVSFDDTRAALGLPYGQNEGFVRQETLKKAKMLLANGENFVWNATHTNAQTLDKSLEMIYQYDGYTIGHHLNVTYQTQEQRNNKRNSTISWNKILHMAEKWNVPSLLDLHELYHYHDGVLQNIEHINFSSYNNDEVNF